MDDPILAVIVFSLDLALFQIDRQISAKTSVIEKESLDHFAAIPDGNEKLLEAVMRIVAHDVPEQRLTANLDHRLRLNLSLFGQAGSDTARQNDNPHQALSPTHTSDILSALRLNLAVRGQ